MLDVLKRIKDANTTFRGDLEFVNDWEYFTEGLAKVLFTSKDMYLLPPRPRKTP